eukprot:TRINITY_DN3882_c0_g1_i2.p1 TRINITY_DN3882_c0_g1~~TRINITY_DN3882_c0_g1_i2.p1  ORF type:complete len:676 (+),score=163.87 TRINITY_DN3882_c0_g1_i2:1630-3657(+)
MTDSSSRHSITHLKRAVDVQRNAALPTADDVPPALHERVSAEAKRRTAKQVAARIERETYDITAHYRGEEKKLRLHKSVTIKEALAKIAALFGEEARPAECLRLRAFTSTGAAGEPLCSTQDDPIERFAPHVRSVLLEACEPNEKFPLYDPQAMTLLLRIYNKGTGKFTQQTVVAKKQATVVDLKEAIAVQILVPVDKQLLMVETPFEKAPLRVLQPDDSVLRRDHQIWDSSKIYLEPCDVAATAVPADSPTLKLVENEKNHVTMTLVVIAAQVGNDDASSSVGEVTMKKSVDKRQTVLQFKQELEAELHIPVAEQCLFKGSVTNKIEIKELDKPMSLHVFSGNLFVERGHPLRPTETVMTFWTYDPKKRQKAYEKAFSMPVDELSDVADVRHQVIERLNAQLKTGEPAVSYVRLREMNITSQYPGKILPDGVLVNKIFPSSSLYTRKAIAVQRLDGPETVSPFDTLMVLTVQRWRPSMFALDEQRELLLPADATAGDIRHMLAACHATANADSSTRIIKSTKGLSAELATSHVSNNAKMEVDSATASVNVGYNKMEVDDGTIPAARMGLSKVLCAGPVQPVNPLEVPQLMWRDAGAVDDARKLTDAPYFLRDGDLVLYRDSAEQLKQLTYEEQQRLRRQAQAASCSYSPYWGRKESPLRIHSGGTTAVVAAAVQ